MFISPLSQPYLSWKNWRCNIVCVVCKLLPFLVNTITIIIYPSCGNYRHWFRNIFSPGSSISHQPQPVFLRFLFTHLLRSGQGPSPYLRDFKLREGSFLSLVPERRGWWVVLAQQCRVQGACIMEQVLLLPAQYSSNTSLEGFNFYAIVPYCQ